MQSKIVVPPEPLELMGRLEAAGEECWVVGGCVRDSLRGVRPADWDMTTSAAMEWSSRFACSGDSAEA